MFQQVLKISNSSEIRILEIVKKIVKLKGDPHCLARMLVNKVSRKVAF